MSDKRKFYRVNTEIAIACTALNPKSKKEWQRRIITDNIKVPDARRQFLMLDTDILENLDKLNYDSPKIAETLGLLNRKLNLIAKGGALVHDESALWEAPYQTVSLSASGVAFEQSTPLLIGDSVLVECVLPPQDTYLTYTASVVRTKKTESSHIIALAIDTIREVDQERIIQHLMKIQAHQLQTKRKLKSHADK